MIGPDPNDLDLNLVNAQSGPMPFVERMLRDLVVQIVQDRSPSHHTAAFSNWMFKHNPRISLQSTSKLAGVPASSVFSPLTIDS